MQQLYICAFILLFIVACGSTEKQYQQPQKEITAEKSKPSRENETKKSNKITSSDPIPKEQIKKAKKLIKNTSPEAVNAVDAKSKYKLFCTTCHGFEGNMMVNGAKDLSKSTIDLTESVAQIYFGKGLMTPFSSMMKDEEIIAVAKYCESLRK